MGATKNVPKKRYKVRKEIAPFERRGGKLRISRTVTVDTKNGTLRDYVKAALRKHGVVPDEVRKTKAGTFSVTPSCRESGGAAKKDARRKAGLPPLLRACQTELLIVGPKARTIRGRKGRKDAVDLPEGMYVRFCGLKAGEPGALVRVRSPEEADRIARSVCAEARKRGGEKDERKATRRGKRTDFSFERDPTGGPTVKEVAREKHKNAKLGRAKKRRRRK